MSSVDALQRGDLQAALAELQKEVRAAPAEGRHRVFLFQLLSVLGDWDRALNQLQVVRDLDPDALLMAQTYQEVVRCEVFRRDVFAGKRQPVILGEPEPWVAKTVEAVRIAAEGEPAAAQDLRMEAWEDAPATAGTLAHAPPPTPGTPPENPPEDERVEFGWIADADSRLGPILEVIVDGRYYWAPFHRIAQIKLESPTDLRDCVWTPANLIWANQGHAVGMIPTRYPGSEEVEDAAIRMAKKTEWREPVADVFEGLGQRLFATDVGEFALMDLRSISLQTETEEPAAEE